VRRGSKSPDVLRRHKTRQGKAETRARYLTARRAMAHGKVAAWSEAILARLRTAPEFRDADTVLCYVSSKDNEVDTHGAIQWLLAEGRTVLVPIAEPEGVLGWSRIEGLDELARARFGILEPRPECRRMTAPPADAVVLVPGIAFAPDGCRVGYGGGYYDRFLAHHAGPAIALAFELQMVDAVDRDPHDVPVDAVVTEKAVYRRAE